MKKIESLTPAQVAKFPEYIERWTDIGLSTLPADRGAAEAAIADMYRQGGLSPPEKIVWCGSPLSQGLTRAIILDKKALENLGASVWASAGDSVWASVKASVWASVKASVWASVRDSVGDSVRDSVRDSVGASVWASVGDSVWDSAYGSQDASLLALYRFFYEVCALTEQTRKLNGLWELSQSAGWALPHKNICWVSERHNILTRDDRGRLHSLSGPACAYPDGWAIYAFHGVRVPQFVIERPREISVATIEKEANAEIRRVMIERYKHGEGVHGGAAYIVDAGGKRLDHDERFGTLWHRDVKDDEPIRMIEVINSTREPTGEFKRYWLRVPPTVNTAHEAVAWSFGKTIKDYMPQIET